MEELREQQMTLTEYMRILYRGRWIITLSFLVIMSATAYYTFTKQPVYEAAGLVMIKEEGSVQSQLFEMTSFMKRETMINNQVEILKSYTLAEDVIYRLQESPHADSLWILGKQEKEDHFSVKKWLFTLLKLDTTGTDNPTVEDLAEDFRDNKDESPEDLKWSAYEHFSYLFNKYTEKTSWTYFDNNTLDSTIFFHCGIDFDDASNKEIMKRLDELALLSQK